MVLLMALAGEGRGISSRVVAGGLEVLLVALDPTSCSSAF